MSEVKKRELKYNLLNKTWSIQMNKSGKSMLKRMVYWGAKKVPLSIRLYSKSAGNTNHHITCYSLLNFHDHKPIVQPLIGILTVHAEHCHPFAGRKSNFIDIIKTGQKRGAIVFVFTPDSVHWPSETITGFMYQPTTKQWKRCTFPLPDVVYNRIPSRGQERSADVQKCIRKLKNIPNLTLFNPHFFNKHELYQILEQSPSLKSHLPQTDSLGSQNDLKNMLSAHKHLYLKPTKGKAGAGIMKVSSHPSSNRFTLYIQKKNVPKKMEMRSFKQLWSKIQKHNISSPYIMQQGIPLAKIDRCPFDFRVLVQKDGQGKWQIAGLGLRVAGVNRITTHVPRGGRIETPTRVLNQLFSKEKAVHIEKRVKTLAIDITKELDNHYSLLGEMSMDIGLDKNENLWFFEANSKPMKFDEPDIRRRSLENIIDYSQYVTFKKEKGGNLLHANH